MVAILIFRGEQKIYCIVHFIGMMGDKLAIGVDRKNKCYAWHGVAEAIGKQISDNQN